MTSTIPLHVGTDAFNPDRKTYFLLRYYTQAYIEAMPGYGKDSLAKTIMVLTSKHCKLLVMDYRGELLAHITRPNPESDEPSCVTPYKAIANFTFPLSAFQDAEDWVSLGFGDGSDRLANLLRNTVAFHKWQPKRVLEMLAALPTSTRFKDGEVSPLADFNRRFGANMLAPVEWHEKNEWINNFQALSGWFYQGPTDPRQLVDFAREWLVNEHLIVNFSDKNGNHDPRIYRAFVGKILQQLRNAGYRRYRGMLVFEESAAVIPYWPHGLRPSSNKQIEDAVKLCRKDHMKLLLIFQNKKQVDKKILEAGAWQSITGRLSDNDMGLAYDPDANDGKGKRQFILKDIGGYGKKIFEPREPVCLYETR